MQRTSKRISLLAGATLFGTIVFMMASVLLTRPEFDHDLTRLERLKRYTLWKLGYELGGTPNFAALDTRLAARGFKIGAPIFVRILKREFELEIWMKRNGRFHLFETYPVCKWSGRLGPKLREGDRQAPEGFYTVMASAMNPASRWHRSFNLGYPNVVDRHHGRTGSFLMVHGGCSSIGCYAMTNPAVDEIWRIAQAAFRAGQRRFHVHAFPFRMTSANLKAHNASKWHEFWKELKAGYDAFEETGQPPLIYACRGRYLVHPIDSESSGGAQAIRHGCPRQHMHRSPKA
ncbi:MAG: L,D-transpeptidase family protein [Hyphomicrobiaceae bacterium]